MRLRLAIGTGLVLLTGLIGCNEDVEPIGLDEGGPSAAPEPGGMPHGHPPTPSTPTKKLRWKLPQTWESLAIVKTGNPMADIKVARLAIPLAKEDFDGERSKPEMTISWTPRGLGSHDANIRRWVNQISVKEGRPAAKIATRDVNGIEVRTVVVTGEFAGGGMGMGRPPAATVTGEQTLYAAIAIVPEGAPYYLKVVGPKATMAAARADIEKFIDSLRLE